MISEELKPLTIGEIFDKTFRLTFATMKRFLPIFIVISLIQVVISHLSQLLLYAIVPGMDSLAYQDDPLTLFANLGQIIIVSLGIGLISGIFSIIFYAFLTDLFIKSYLNEEWQLGDSLQKVLKKIHILLLTGIMAVTIALSGLLACGVGAIATSIFVSFIIPAIVFEEQGIGGSIIRSFKLVSYDFGGLLGSYLLWGLMMAFASFVFGGILSTITLLMSGLLGELGNFGSLSSSGAPLFSLATLFSIPFSMIIVAVTTALNFAFNVILFFNQKVKYENFGMERMAEAFVTEQGEMDDAHEAGDPPQHYR